MSNKDFEKFFLSENNELGNNSNIIDNQGNIIKNNNFNINRNNNNHNLPQDNNCFIDINTHDFDGIKSTRHYMNNVHL